MSTLNEDATNFLVGLVAIAVFVAAIFGVVHGCNFILDKTENIPEKMETVTVEKMHADLGSNEIKAQKKYADNWFEIVGRLGGMDSDGDYFSLKGEVISIIDVHCSIPTSKKEELTNKLSKMKKGERIAVKAKVTEMGEIMGYTVKVVDIYKKP